MTVRFAYSADHLSASNNVADPEGWNKLWTQTPFVPKTATKIFSISNGEIATSSSETNAWAAIVLDPKKVMRDNPAKSWFGFRTRQIARGSSALNTPVAYLALAGYPAVSTVFNLITQGDYISDLTANEGKASYIELGFEWATGQVERRIDGVYKDKITVTDLAAQFATGDVMIHINTGSTVYHSLGIRDMVWVDNVGNGDLEGPIGPQSLILLEQTLKTPTTWTSSSGNVQDPLTAKMGHTVNQATPILTAAVPLTPLDMTLKVPTGRNIGRINGLISMAGGGLTNGISAPVTTKFRRNGADANSVGAAVFKMGLTYQNHAGFCERSPDGSRWTEATLNETSMIVTVDE